MTNHKGEKGEPGPPGYNGMAEEINQAIADACIMDEDDLASLINEIASIVRREYPRTSTHSSSADLVLPD